MPWYVNLMHKSIVNLMVLILIFNVFSACDVCGKMFFSNANLLKHKESSTIIHDGLPI